MRLIATWLGFVRSPGLSRLTQEFAPLSPSSTGGLLILGVGAVYVATLASLSTWPRVSWLLPLPWLWLAFGHARHAPLFAVAATIAIGDMLPRTRCARGLAALRSPSFEPPLEPAADRGLRAATFPAVAVLVSFALQMAHLRVPLVGHGWAELDPSHWPLGLEPELRSLESEDAPTPVFNDCLFGGFLIYALPRYRVYVDDRIELYGEDWLAELFAAEDSADPSSYVREATARYGVRIALTQTGSGFDRYFQHAGDWAELKRTAAGALWVRKPDP
jgi:hypothetical protein